MADHSALAAERRIRTLLPQMAAASSSDPVGHIEQAPLDPILGTKLLYLADKNPKKVNLGIGAYRTDEGAPYVLDVVREADRRVAANRALNKEYLSQSGLPAFCDVARDLLFGSDCAAAREGRITTVQSLSGTGALRLAAEFIRRFFPDATVYFSDPTWGNHQKIFTAAGVQHKKYRYWDPKGRRLDIDGMIADLRAAPRGSFVTLHACAHNPTGVDPTEAQWKEILRAVREGGLRVLFDSAYQGFASGDLSRDAYSIRLFTAELKGTAILACQSFAKNLGLYNERVGTFNVVCGSPDSAKAVHSQLNLIIRAMYSNPPSHGAFLVSTVLGDPELYRQWTEELKAMSHRIIAMRDALRGELERLGTPGDWSHITSQIGMFSFTGLSPPQCEVMIKKYSIYLLKNGRISMSGVNSSNAKYIAAAIDDVVRNVR